MGDRQPIRGRGPFRLGDWVVKPESGSLRRGVTKVHLEPKILELLLYLARNRGRVVSKEELFESVWPDTFVAESALSRCISQLRHALGDDSREPRYIETLPKMGYRLVAPISEPATTHSQERFTTKRVLPLGVATLVFLAFFSYEPARRQASAPPISLIVFQVADIGDRQEIKYLGEGLTSEIVSALSRIPGIRVAHADSAALPEGTLGKEKYIADALGASLLFVGTLQQASGHARVVAKLIDARRDHQLWNSEYTVPLDQVLEIPREIARQVAAAVGVELPSPEAVQLARSSTADIEAYKLYLSARHFRDMETSEALHKAVHYYLKAIDRDPSFAGAYAGLAEAYFGLGSWGQCREWSEKAQGVVSQGLSLDNSAPEVHVAKGIILKGYFKDFLEAESAFKEALRIDPLHIAARREYGLLLMRRVGRLDEAMLHLQFAHNVDPLSERVNSNLVELYRLRGEYDKAIQIAQRHFEFSPMNPRGSRNLALLYFLLGRHEEAVRWAKKSVELQQEFDLKKGHHFERAFQLITLIYLHSGNIHQARETCQRLLLLDPTGAQSLGMAGLLALWTGDSSGAIEHFQAATKLNSEAFLWPSGVRLLTFLAFAQRQAGYREESDRTLLTGMEMNQAEEVERGERVVPPEQMLDIAAVYAVLGATDDAFRWLVNAAESGWRGYALVCDNPLWEDLRGEARVQQLLARLESEVDLMHQRVVEPSESAETPTRF
jgi:adenylate cyclase